MGCKYIYDEICVNPDCPYRADYCPVTEFPEVCRFAEEQKEAEKEKGND